MSEQENPISDLISTEENDKNRSGRFLNMSQTLRSIMLN